MGRYPDWKEGAKLGDRVYQGAWEAEYPDGPGASPEDLAREKERTALLESIKAALESGSYLIWSLEHEAWWARGRQGYTRDKAQAGRYSLIEARAICQESNRFTEPGQLKEAMVPL